MKDTTIKIINGLAYAGAAIAGVKAIEMFFKDKPRPNPTDKWIQGAVEDPGRVRRYLKRKYGKKDALNEDGTINMATLNKAIKGVKANPRRNQQNLLDALELAKRLKENA